MNTHVLTYIIFFKDFQSYPFCVGELIYIKIRFDQLPHFSTEAYALTFMTLNRGSR